jgi:L-rhamnose-H+ transport protein
MTQDLVGVLGRASSATLFWAWFFGLLWGLGGLTFGLTMRYLGMSLGLR